LSTVRTGTKVERSISELASSIVPIPVASESRRKWWQQ